MIDLQPRAAIVPVTNVDTGHEFPAAGRAVVTFTCT
jgi:hypothetical protein